TSSFAWAPPRVAVVGTVGHPDDPSSFSIGRLDGDAIGDAVLAHGADDRPPWLLRGGIDGFAAPEPWDELPPSRGVAVIDVDGRGDDELFVITDGGDTLEIWQGEVGALQRLGRTDISAQAGRLLALGDIDGDGRLDLAFFAPDSDRIDIWLADRNWKWRDTDSVRIGASVDQLAIADLDGDGAAELVASTFAQGGITLVRSEP
ncbi:MAG: VCBS repeat-containing protein, partial [Deltaproteobacteria bacterium]|nr:VCBS repeat-containing protein [Nannocystaceae bacterium]